jgi:TRAP-type mannitol/chloroaromatic compound transport system substrate-binding protein
MLYNKKGVRKMKSKNSILIITAMTIILFAMPAFCAEPIKWKVQNWVGVTDLAYASLEKLCKKVKVATNGRLEMTPLPVDAVVSGFEMLDAIKNNVLQAGVIASVYWAGKEPAFALTGDLTAGWDHPYQADAFYYQYGGLELLRETYKPFGVYPVGVTWVGLEVMPSTKCIRKVSDFKGLKWRMPGGLGAEVLKRYGAVAVVLPGSEVYQGLEKGIIDGADWGTASMNLRMNFHQVAKFYNYPGFHSLALMDFSVNQGEWNKLPEDIKAILESAVREYAWEMVDSQALDSYKAIETMKAAGVTQCVWTKEDLAEARKIAQGVWEEYSKKSPQALKVYTALMNYFKLIGRDQTN